MRKKSTLLFVTNLTDYPTRSLVDFGYAFTLKTVNEDAPFSIVFSLKRNIF